jgi:glycosyltransferase involved in cell wall biosynthesis
MLILFSLLSFAIWVFLFFAWGNFWRSWESDFDRAQIPLLRIWPAVSAVIPARNEAASIAAVVRALAAQDYSGKFSVTIVDDHSEDDTSELAQKAVAETGAGFPIRVLVPELATGWTWALNAGAQRHRISWFLGRDDVIHAPEYSSRLFQAEPKLDLTFLSFLNAKR